MFLILPVPTSMELDRIYSNKPEPFGEVAKEKLALLNGKLSVNLDVHYLALPAMCDFLLLDRHSV